MGLGVFEGEYAQFKSFFSRKGCGKDPDFSATLIS